MRKRTADRCASGKSAKSARQLPTKTQGGNGSGPFRAVRPNIAAIRPDKKLRSVLRRYENALRAYPADAGNWFDYGKLLLNIGQNQLAETALHEAVRRAPESANYRYYLGNALGNNGKFPEAAHCFMHLASIDPGLQDPMSMVGLSVLTDLGYCLGEMGRWADAFTTLQPAVETAVSILSDLANFSAGAGECERACFLYSVALLLSPHDADLLHGAGSNHMKCDRLKEAREHLQRAAKADPEDPDIWYDFGLTLARMKEGKDARPCFRKVLQLDAHYFWAWYDLACLDALDNKPAAAFRNLYKAVECGFKDADFLLRDPDFESLRDDPRWKVVLDCIADAAKLKKEAGATLEAALCASDRIQ